MFRDHLADSQDVAQRLRGFEIVMAMRERTPFPRRLLEEPAQPAHYDRHAQCSTTLMRRETLALWCGTE